MFSPREFDLQLNDRPVTVRIIHYQPRSAGTDVEPPTEEYLEYQVYDVDGEMNLSPAEDALVYFETLKHIKYALEEKDL